MPFIVAHVEEEATRTPCRGVEKVTVNQSFSRPSRGVVHAGSIC